MGRGYDHVCSWANAYGHSICNWILCAPPRDGNNNVYDDPYCWSYAQAVDGTSCGDHGEFCVQGICTSPNQILQESNGRIMWDDNNNNPRKRRKNIIRNRMSVFFFQINRALNM
jgi:hypothetical protein